MSEANRTTLLDRLIAAYPLAKRQTFKRMLEARRIRVNGVPARSLKVALAATDVVTVEDRGGAGGTESAAPARRPPAIDVVYEDDDVIVVNKPAGLLTSTVPREKRPTLVAKVREHVAASGGAGARVGVIHRLDREVSGLLVFSKNDAAYQSLKEQLFHRKVGRSYLAVVAGKVEPPQGRIESRLVEFPNGKVRTTRRPTGGERAVTDYETVATNATRRSLLRVTLLTGRKHQIRAHLSERGHPVVGDTLYGGPPASRLMLCSVSLAFAHPRTGEPKQFTIEPPAEFAKAFPEYGR